MQQQQILQASYLDILFEYKNKNYGAYQLRKSYNVRLYKAISITLLLAVGVVLLLSSFKPKANINVLVKPPIITSTIAIPRTKETPKHKQPKTTTKAIKANTKVYAQPNLVSETVEATFTNATVVPTPITTANGGEPSDGDLPPSQGGGTDTIATAKQIILPPTIVDNNTPMDDPDIAASYPGGKKALALYLQQKLESETVENGEPKKIIVIFIVEKDGSITNVSTQNNSDQQFVAKTIKAFNQMKKWIPATEHKELVRQYIAIPVTITPNDEEQ